MKPDLTPAPDANQNTEFLQQLQGCAAEDAIKRLRQFLQNEAAKFLGFESAEHVGPRDNFMNLGFDSLRAVDFKTLLESRLICSLRSTLLFDYPTLETLTNYLAHEILAIGLESAADSPNAADAAADAKDYDHLSAGELRVLLARNSTKLRVYESARYEPVAIVGIGCRFPGGASNPGAFWKLLMNATDAIVEVPPERWNLDDYYDSDRGAPGKMYTRFGGFLTEPIDQFDAAFFNISPREAAQLDPQQRLLLETAWEALEDGCHSPEKWFGSKTGVFVGLRESEYFNSQTRRHATEVGSYYATGNALSTASGRLSYFFGFTGPCFSLDTACSSSLVALHLACQSIRKGECSAALAAGVSLILDPVSNIALSKASMLAPDGRCKTFDASADGYGRSEGCGVVILKPLSRALADRDRIIAIIRGSALNQDGASGGLTVPNGPSQSNVIKNALADGRVMPYEIGYIEAHGTGTSLGDPIEVGALDSVFGSSRLHDAPLVVGSVKTNIGHLETAAGIAGIIKTALILERGVVPRSLHYQNPNPHIPWKNTVVKVANEPIPWERGPVPRLAGVSSFGFSGTNAHIVLAEAPATNVLDEPRNRPYEILPLSAASPEALRKLMLQYSAALAEPNGPADLGSICYSAGIGRTHFSHRAAVAARDITDLREQLELLANGSESLGGVRGRSKTKDARIAFLFTGQGSQYAGMARELYDVMPQFRVALDRCAALLNPLLQKDLYPILWGADSNLLDETEYTQPAIFSVEYALSQLWQSMGIVPSCMLGHSIGEYAAACVAGVFSLEDAILLIAARGRLMKEKTQRGSMAAVAADRERVERFIWPHSKDISIAAENGPSSFVISGDSAILQKLIETAKSEKLEIQPLTVSHAFHSPLMEPMLDAFREVANKVRYQTPAIPWISTVTAKPVGTEVAQSEYWVGHVRNTVRFHSGMLKLMETEPAILLEIGPGPVLLGMARRFVKNKETAWVPSLRKGQPDTRQMFGALGELYIRGVELDWEAVHQNCNHRKVTLPTYPFDRKRHWLERTAGLNVPNAEAGRETQLLGTRIDSPALPAGDLLYESILRESSPSFLKDHRVYDIAIFPGAGYVEIALEAARAIPGLSNCVLENITIQAALALSSKVTKIQTHVSKTAGAEDRYHWKIYSLSLAHPGAAGGAGEWVLHASGTLRALPVQLIAENQTDGFTSILARCREPRNVGELYEYYKTLGLEYGPAFRTLKSVRTGGGEAICEIQLSEETGIESYQIHPTLLDACFQGCGALLPGAGNDAYLPIGFEKIIQFSPKLAWTGRSAVCRVARRESIHSSDSTSGALPSKIAFDLDIFDTEGAALARVEGLQLIRTNRNVVLRESAAAENLLYEVKWRRKARSENGVRIGEKPGLWWIVSDDVRLARKWKHQLEKAGDRVLLTDIARSENGSAIFYDTTIKQIQDGGTPLRGVLFSATRGVFDLTNDGEGSLGPIENAFYLFQSLGRARWKSPPRVWLITRAAQPVPDSSGAKNPWGGALWGFGASLALEHPEFRTARIDLEDQQNDQAPDLASTELVISELLHPDFETQIAFRGGERFVARLERAANRKTRLEPPPNSSYQLRAAEYGSFEQLSIVPAPVRSVQAGEVEIDVLASALNFKDVLYTLGLLKDLSERAGIHRAADQPLGLECAGRVRSAGAGVKSVCPGDFVIASAVGTLGNNIIVREEFVSKCPERITPAAAAAIPTVFLTSLYSLFTIANLRAGERVLIHAGAGGVGQAAIQLAKRAGAEIYATASPAKWEHLRAQGISHIYNSRNVAFSEEILRDTKGAGVDVILNSLSGDWIPKSLAILARGGRFVEIGRIGIWPRERVAAERPDVQYSIVDMAEVFANDTRLYRKLMDEVLAGFADGSLSELSTKTYALADAGNAFRDLAQAKNVGKVVIQIQGAPASRNRSVSNRNNCAYIITGGLGALGLKTAEWLIREGARKVILTSRRTPPDETNKLLAQLRGRGADVIVYLCDISDPERSAELVQNARRDHGPIGGIVHAAGVLDDGMLIQSSWNRFVNVLKPKAFGAVHLANATQNDVLDFFINFSSMASVVGAQGQSSYSAANAFLDTFAHVLRNHNIPAISINWGPWSGGGMAAGREGRNRARFAEMGLRAISPEEGMNIFTDIVRKNDVQSGVLPIQWGKFIKQFRAGGAPPFYEIVSPRADSNITNTAKILEELHSAAPAQRTSKILNYVREQIARVLGFGSPSQVDPDVAFVEMGVDSLLAVDLRNRIETGLSLTLPATLLFEQPNASALAAHLADLIFLQSAPDVTDDLVDEVDRLTEEEAEKLLKAGEGDE
ncbi:MAG: SDR family NAD(P)-dependent oxidoreductase [Planctomycetota bacterium]